jgi:hypothetical protein
MVVYACDEEAVSHQKSSNHRCEVLAPLRDFWKGEAKVDYAANRVCSLQEQRFAIPDAVSKQRSDVPDHAAEPGGCQQDRVYSTKGSKPTIHQIVSSYLRLLCWFVESLHPIFCEAKSARWLPNYEEA